MKKHLAIMNKQTIEAILGGIKTIETRFSKAKIAPFGVVGAGDLVYMKPPGGEIIGQFKVKKVILFDGVISSDIENIFKDFGKEISVGDIKEDKKYQKEKMDSKYATLIFISESERFITSPIRIKKSDMRGWVVLN